MAGPTDVTAVADLALAYQAAMKATGDRLARVLLGMLASLEPWNLTGQWVSRLPEAVGAFTAAQVVAAGMADPYLARSLAAHGIDATVGDAVAAGGFGGVSASGLPLETLLTIPLARADQALAAGAGRDLAVRGASSALSMYARTEVADAARSSAQASMASNGVAGYIRHVGALCCSRCAILSGRWYRYSAGFQRHPRCHCVQVPQMASVTPPSPMDLYREGRITDLTVEEKQALDLGSDLNQVVNAKRGLYVAGDVRLTREGTTRAGVAGARLLAADMARIRGATPGVYGNFTVSRAELAAFTAKYGPVMRRGNPFARLTPTGVTTVSAPQRAVAGRLTPAEIFRLYPGRREQLVALVNNGYLMKVPGEIAA